MSDHIKKTIAELQTKLREQEESVAFTRRTINDLCRLAGMKPMYADVMPESKISVTSIRGDQFYGRALASVVREYLEMRRTSNLGPAPVSEIYDALILGGFKFETKNDANSIRGLRQSLTKNSGTFHKLPRGEYGLLEWYPSAKQDGVGDATTKKGKAKGRPKRSAKSGPKAAAQADAPAQDAG